MQVLPQPPPLQAGTSSGVGTIPYCYVKPEIDTFVGGRAVRCEMHPLGLVMTGSLSFQMLDYHLLIPWGLGAAVLSLPAPCMEGKCPVLGAAGSGTGRLRLLGLQRRCICSCS